MNEDRNSETRRSSHSKQRSISTSSEKKSIESQINLSSFRDKNGNPVHVKFEDNRVHIADNKGTANSKTRNDRSILPSRRLEHLRINSESSIIDRRPRRPSPFRSQNSDQSNMMSETPNTNSSGTTSKQTSKSGYHPVSQDEETFESIGLKPVTLGSQLKMRKGKSPNEGLALDTSVNSNQNEGMLLIPRGETSAVSPAVKKPYSFFGRRKGDTTSKSTSSTKIVLKPRRKESDSDSSDNELKHFVTRRADILSKIDQQEVAAIDQIPIEEGREITRQYLKLIDYLELGRIFFDPELEIINRFCLEYTALCAKTEDHSLFKLRSETHFCRVFNALEERTNSIGTPTDRYHPGPEIPVLLTRLVLGEFRIKSDGKSNANINVPLFSHHQRLDARRFERIVTLVFERKRYFEGRIDVSRHGLSHLA
jgi:hypothetical protein